MSWSALDVTADAFLHACRAEDLTGLVHARLGRMTNGAHWPVTVREELAGRARADAAHELLRRREIASVLNALADAGVYPVLFKGTPLAYDVYAVPHFRARSDTDLLIPRSHVNTVRLTLEPLGYRSPVYCGGELLFRQFELARTDEFGVTHAFDFHWKISTQSVFADVLTYDELAAQAVPIAALGPGARAAGPVHALLLACIHPVMHHRNAERLIWLYDIHLIASRLTAAEFDRFADLARDRQVAAVCARQLAVVRQRFGLRVPDQVTTSLAGGAREPSAEYLQLERRWHDELSASLRSLSRWTDRMRLLQEVLFPAPSYILRAYGHTPGSLSTVLLPALYLHRGVRGGIKVLIGRK